MLGDIIYIRYGKKTLNHCVGMDIMLHFLKKKKIYFNITMRHYEHMVQEHVILSRIINPSLLGGLSLLMQELSPLVSVRKMQN